MSELKLTLQRYIEDFEGNPDIYYSLRSDEVERLLREAIEEIQRLRNNLDMSERKSRRWRE